MTVGHDTPVVTGIGVIAPNGVGIDEFWAAIRSGRNGIKPITRFGEGAYPACLGGVVDGVDPARQLPGRLRPQTDRSTQFALLATDWAIALSDLDIAALDEFAGSVVTANAIGGLEFIQQELASLRRKGPRHVTAYMSYAWFYGVNTGQISIKNQLRGPSGVIVSGHAGGLDAFGQARRRLRMGQRFVVTGGTDAPLCPFGMAAELAGHSSLSTSADRARAYTPFGRHARGHVMGEGCAMMIVEPLESARSRGARVHGAITGHGSTFDPAPGSGRPPTLARAAGIAIADAGIDPGEIDVVLADGAACPSADLAEARAIRELFGPYGVPVTVPKTMTGRLLGAAGALDVATALMAIEHGEIPPTIGTAEPDESYEIDLVVGTLRKKSIRHVLVLAKDGAGFNSALVVSGVQCDTTERTFDEYAVQRGRSAADLA